MQRIRNRLYSHLSHSNNKKNLVSEILASEAKVVTTYQQLVKLVAEISYNNSDYVLFYRGQHRDHTKLSSGERISSFYPSIYRFQDSKSSSVDLKERFTILEANQIKLLEAMEDRELNGYDKLKKFPELIWAILQHYEVCDTPLLDLTHSLRVAASFALNENPDDGYLFIFGFPHPNSSITYSVELELLNIRLLSICPPEAHRPYYQEAFLVGTFPSYQFERRPSLDIGCRLIAKFKLSNDTFWSSSFPPISKDALLPKKDIFKSICEEFIK